jgi:type VI secretion system ImpM family protein
MFSFLNKNKTTSEPERITGSGCFGKLPIYDDFIRYNVHGRKILELDEWIQQGYSHHTRRAQINTSEENLDNSSYHFLLTGSLDKNETVVGTLMGSEDKSGRQYPFVIFKSLSGLLSNSSISNIPCEYKRYFESNHNLLTTDWCLQPISVLEKRIEKLDENITTNSELALTEKRLEALDNIKKEVFWNDLLDSQASLKGPVYIEIMRDLLNTVVRKNPLKTAWGIEMPLPYSDRVYEYVTFWLSLAESTFSGRGWQPQCIWGDINNTTRQSLYLFFRPITPMFLSYLLGNRVDNGVLINLDDECSKEINVSLAAEQIGSLDADESLLDAINDWTDWSQKR